LGGVKTNDDVIGDRCLQVDCKSRLVAGQMALFYIHQMNRVNSRGFRNNSSDLTHLKQQRSGLSSKSVIIDRAINVFCGPVSRLKGSTLNTSCNFRAHTLFWLKRFV